MVMVMEVFDGKDGQSYVFEKKKVDRDFSEFMRLIWLYLQTSDGGCSLILLV